MDVFTAIEKRYSYRGEFRLKAVPRPALRLLVQGSIEAPPWFNRFGG